MAAPSINTPSDFGTMVNLVYTYDSGNKLLKVLDNGNDTFGFKDGANIATEYTYDANANLITDANKGITSISYNHLNLPVEVNIDDEGSNVGTISYIYDATGVKLEKKVTEGSTITKTLYAGNYVYEKPYLGIETLKFFNMPEGYVEPDGSSGYDYVYQYKDHLGNIRLSYKDNNGTLEILEENNYYPFGLKHNGYNSNIVGNDHLYGFNGKEEQNELGLGWIDITARNYNPELGRWMNLDPLAEESRRWTPYNFTYNNPLRFIDPDGMSADDIIFKDKNGDVVATYYTDKVEDEVIIPVDVPEASNINLNEIMKSVTGMEDIDVVGVGVNFDFTFVMGGGTSLEAVYFLDGEDAGQSEFYKTTRQNVGLDGALGIYSIEADYFDDENLTTEDYLGRSFSVGGDLGEASATYFWAPKEGVSDGTGVKSLLNSELRAWSGFNVGIGAGGGGQWSKQDTQKYKP